MKNSALFILLTCIAFLLFLIDIAIGAVDIPLAEVVAALSGGECSAQTRTIVLDLRLIKAVTALLAGIALGISGLQMQTLFRNPLAGPYVLGLSSGASLGVALLLLTGVSGTFGIAGAAMAGAAAIMLLLLIANERVKDVMTLLVLGILASSAISAIVQILQYLSNEQALKAYVIWTMGSLGEVTRPQLAVLSGAIAIGVIISIFTLKPLNLLMMGDTYARTAGLNLRRSRFMLLLSTTLLAGGITAFCGPIGFVGLAVPHIARAIFRSADHRVLIPASALLGAIMLVSSDIISRHFLIPINAITSLAGIPIVIYIVLRK